MHERKAQDHLKHILELGADSGRLAGKTWAVSCSLGAAKRLYKWLKKIKDRRRVAPRDVFEAAYPDDDDLRKLEGLSEDEWEVADEDTEDLGEAHLAAFFGVPFIDGDDAFMGPNPVESLRPEYVTAFCKGALAILEERRSASKSGHTWPIRGR